MGLFSKKDKSGSADAGASDADRKALFGSKGKSGSPAPNPYAQPAAPPPYSGGGMSDRARAEKTPVPAGGYGGAGAGSYGGGGAYGQDRYGGSGGGGTASRYGAGGYGGMGEGDAGRQELFGNAGQQRAQAGASPSPGPGTPGGGAPGGGFGGPGGGGQSSYGAYQDRQLTAEEEEEEDVQSAKQQMRFSKFD